MTGPHVYIDPTAEVDGSADIGEGTRIWGHAYVAAQARIGKDCLLARNTHVGRAAVMGDGCKLQDGSGITTGVELGNRVFVGPNVTFCNDKDPRVGKGGFVPCRTVVDDEAVICAAAVIDAGVRIGRGAKVAPGAVVCRDVPPGMLAVGNPARIIPRLEAGR